jgi:hypothetical protein
MAESVEDPLEKDDRDAGWEANRRRQLTVGLDATPAQRLPGSRKRSPLLTAWAR